MEVTESHSESVDAVPYTKRPALQADLDRPLGMVKGVIWLTTAASFPIDHEM